ncbi:type VII secretion target [Mycobacterium kansasii]
MSEPISLDTDAVAATVAEWRGYADQVERHGSHRHVPLDELSTALGEVYEEFVQAKRDEYQARQAAYQRMANRARGHADRLEGTRQILTSTDDEQASRINGVFDT